MFHAFVPGSYTEGGGHTEDESNYPGWRDGGTVESAEAGSRRGTLDHRNDPRMEERKTKAMHMLSKLQNETPRKSINKGCSNFEECESITTMRNVLHLCIYLHLVHSSFTVAVAVDPSGFSCPEIFVTENRIALRIHWMRPYAALYIDHDIYTIITYIIKRLECRHGAWYACTKCKTNHLA